MKRSMKFITSGAVMLFSITSHAQILLHLSADNSCETVSGHWAGQGSAYNWLLGTCKYHGSGTISELDSQGNFSLMINADKDSGSMLCPDHHNEQLNGSCANGLVTIKTGYGDISGVFEQNTGSAKGTLSVAPGMEADVSVQFSKSR